MPDFKNKVLKIVSKIPRGHVLTYKQVAERAGRPNAYRAVGNVLRQNYNPKIPCHRVIGSDGKMRGYNRGGVERKKELLKEDGAW